MEHINRTDLSFIGKGANSSVYKYNKPYGPGKLDMVVKITSNAKNSIKNYEVLKKIGCDIVIAELCSIEGKEAVIMHNLFTKSEVYVSPNSYRNGHIDNLPEAYLKKNKIKGIANIDSLLCQLSDLARSCDSNGVELLIDMISFGVPKCVNFPSVSYKIVDVDGMLYSEQHRNRLLKCNMDEAKWALEVFVENCVVESEQANLLEKINSYNWM